MHNSSNKNTFNEYCTGVPSSDGQCLHVAMFYTPQNHPAPGAPLAPIQHQQHQHDDNLPPSYEEALSTPRILPSRPTLPPLSTLLASMGAAPSSPPPPYTPLPKTPAPRFPVYHARYRGNAVDGKDTSQDHHKLFILTSAADEGSERGIYIHLTGTKRRGLRLAEATGDVPENTAALRSCTFLGTISGDDLDALQSIAGEIYMDKFPAKRNSGSSGSSTHGRKHLLPAPCRFLQQYTLNAPPPPYGTDDVLTPEPLASPSQAWVAAVIDLAQARGVLRRY